MKDNIEEKIQEEIRRRALEHAALRDQEGRNRLDTEANLEALGEITGLPSGELEKIEKAVRASYARKENDFFSIKNQLFLAILIGMALIGILILVVWLF